MNFAHPEAFLLLALLPVYGAFHWARSRKNQGLPLSTFDTLYQERQRWVWQSTLPALLYLTGFCLLVCALARPQFGKEVTYNKQEGVDIILALDISGSMYANDFKPTRLEAAKSVIQEFIQNQKVNRVGVVVFSGTSYTLLPLTTDYQLAEKLVGDVDFYSIDPKSENAGATNIAMAIFNATYRFKEDNKKSRVLVLLTDGEDSKGPEGPIAAAEAAAQKNVRIYTIGIGSEEGLVFRVPNSNRRLFFKVDAPTLKEIARKTGGAYFHAGNNNTLREVYKRIDSMEKAELEVRKNTVYMEQMAIFLWPAFWALLLGFILSHSVALVVRL